MAVRNGLIRVNPAAGVLGEIKTSHVWIAMGKGSGKLTVFFEDPFWVGVFEVIENGKLSVAKVTFGAEPKDYKVWKFIIRNYYDLRFSPAVATVVKEGGRNPKRMQREAKKQTLEKGIGTKSQ